jgi:hypothetical protein
MTFTYRRRVAADVLLAEKSVRFDAQIIAYDNTCGFDFSRGPLTIMNKSQKMRARIAQKIAAAGTREPRATKKRGAGLPDPI